MRWTVLVVRLPADPSRHRVAVWRELRRVGALSLGQGVWAAPATPAFTAGRQAEWAEFLSDCGKYEAELDKELRIQKFTLAELDEEEQSLERLRRWYRELKVRDLFGAPAAAEAEQRLKHCAERLEDYADRVYQAVHQP